METGLHYTIRKVQKKTIKTTLEKSNHHKLSIQYTLDGFSFCITNLDSQETIHFCAYTFPKTLETPEKLVAHFETIFQEDNHLQEDFKEILDKKNLARKECLLLPLRTVLKALKI